MSNYRVIIKPEEGEVLSRQNFETKEEMKKHVAGIRERADDMFARTTKDLLIIITEGFYEDDWREIDRESLMR